MAESLQIVVATSPVNVAVSTTPQPVAVAATVQNSSVQVAAAAPHSVALAAVLQPQSVTVEVVEAQPGVSGTSVTPVILTLAAYLALSAPEQLDPTKWYVIPA